MRSNQGHSTGCFIDLPGFNPHKAVLDNIDTPNPLGTGAAVGFLNRLQRGDRCPIDRYWNPLFERDGDLIFNRWEGGIICVRGDVFRWGVPNDLQVPSFSWETPIVML